jgi:C4-dicarboxylate-specific signal transduction histidine kinase
LHNVGNALNSVNTSAAVIAGMIENSSLPGLTQTSLLLHSHASDLGFFLSEDPTGRLVPAYVTELAQVLEAERTAVVSELSSLLLNIDHIKAIVRMQQSNARATPDIGREVVMQDLVEDALKVTGDSLSWHGIVLDRQFDEGARLTTDRHKVIQILVNLLTNAKDAVIAADRVPRTIALKISSNAQSVHFSVTDNGTGIAKDNLDKIFNYGFTTKREGHGFGLHSSALAAIELGGALTASSGGLGQGATFTLQLPKHRPERIEENSNP